MGAGVAASRDSMTSQRSQEMQRRIKEREGGTFAGGIERRAGGHFVTPFNVRGRECAQRSCHFGHSQIRQVACFELSEPLEEDRWEFGRHMITSIILMHSPARPSLQCSTGGSYACDCSFWFS